MHLSIRSVLSVSTLLTLAGFAHAQPKVTPVPSVQKVGPAPIGLTVQDGYELIALPGESGRLSYARAISASGQVGGDDKTSESGDPRAVLWNKEGTSSTLPHGSGGYSSVVGFTPNGEVISRTDDTGYKGNTAIGQSLIFGGGVPLGVGTQGKIVGAKYRWKTENNGATAVGYVGWANSDTLKVVPGFTDSYAYGANGAGVVVGAACNGVSAGTPTRAVRWEKNGTAVLLPGKGANNYGVATAIDDKGTVIGGVGSGDNLRAARWNNDQFVELGGLGGRSVASAINASGVIVGSATDADGDHHGVVFRGGKAVDLNTLIHRPTFMVQSTTVAKQLTAAERLSFLATDWIVQGAVDINDKGEIAAWAVKLGKTYAVILRPTYKSVTIASSEEVKTTMQTVKPSRTREATKEFPQIVLKRRP